LIQIERKGSTAAETDMAQPRRANKEEGGVDGARILVVEGRFYDEISDALLAGAKRAFEKAGVDFDLVTVPGALEIPQAIAITVDIAQARHRPFDGVVALGCVIRGETSHYDIVAGESARALMDLAVARQLPIGNGILTVNTEAQALARARPEEGDKGGWAVEAALTLVRLKRGFQTQRVRR
jgi:6,7-dimethyl-8-ribityllumazine synthase